jgi:hypothetical protein
MSGGLFCYNSVVHSVLDVLSCYPSLLGMLVISKLVLAYAREKLSIYGMSKVLLFEKLPLQWRG